MAGLSGSSAGHEESQPPVERRRALARRRLEAAFARVERAVHGDADRRLLALRARVREGGGGELAAARRAASAGTAGRQGSGRGGVRRRTTRSGALHHAVGAVVVALAGGDSVSAHKERGERQATTKS